MDSKKRVVALGFFDGVHIGHAALLNRTKSVAIEYGYVSSVLSFDVHPDTLVFGKDVALINDDVGREKIINEYFDIHDVIFIHFSKEIMHMPWQDFLKNIISELNVAWIVVGHDFTFGNRGEGNAERLSQYCKEHGIGCDVIEAVKLDDRIVSSTYIRELLLKGNIEEANRYLGHPHVLHDVIRSGFHLGTKMGTPTINMNIPNHVIVPKNGVYATKVYVNGSGYFTAVTNIGVRPTVSDSNMITVESHLLDFNGNLYNKEAKVEFYKFLREEKKFSDYNELAEQIHKDASMAMEYFE